MKTPATNALGVRQPRCRLHTPTVLLSPTTRDASTNALGVTSALGVRQPCCRLPWSKPCLLRALKARPHHSLGQASEASVAPGKQATNKTSRWRVFLHRKKRDSAYTNRSLIHSLLTCATLFLAAAPAFAQSPRGLNNRGVDAYASKKYDKAVQDFQKAQEQAPDNLMVTYNLGAAESATSKPLEALGAFQKATGARDADLANRARFAEGVLQYNQALQKTQQQDLQGALESAKAAAAANQNVLLADPTDTDARVNFELSGLLRKEIEKQLQQQQQQNKNQQQNQDQQKHDQKQDQQKQEQQQQQQDQQGATPTPTQSPEQQNKQDQKQQDENKQDQGQGATPTPTPSPDQQGKQQQAAAPTPTPSPGQQQQQAAQQQKQQEANKQQDETASILNVLDNNDNEALKRMLKQRYGNIMQPAKDW